MKIGGSEPAVLPDSPPSREKSIFDRLVSIIATVEEGEAKGAFLLALNLFLLLAGYYILKTVREALILSEGGAEVKSYSSALQVLLLLILVPAYGLLASRLHCLRCLITWVTLFFISHLVIFFFLGRSGVSVGVAFFLWVGIFNVLLIAQFWGFVNGMYTLEQGKRLFAIIGLGSALGAWLGAQVAARLFSLLGPYSLMLLAATILLVSVVISWMGAQCAPSGPNWQPLGKIGGFRLVLTDRYLFLIALLILLVNVVNTTGEFLLGKLVVMEADRVFGLGNGMELSKQAFIGGFYGRFFGWVNLLTVLFQLFLVSRIFKYIGMCQALLILPVIAMAGYGLLAALPLLGVVQVAKVLENSTDYSIQNTARHALFLPTSREAKYKAKTAIDTFFWRVGDMLQAALVFIGVRLAFDVGDYALVNIGFAGAWILVVLLIHREQKKLPGAYC